MVYHNYLNPYTQQNISPYNSNAQRFEIIHVNGRNGAEMLQMAPNSNVLLLDDTAPIVWLAQTDGAGYKTITPFDITQHKDAPAVDLSSLESRISALEEKINAKSNITNNGNNKQYQNGKKPNEHDSDS